MRRVSVRRDHSGITPPAHRGIVKLRKGLAVDSNKVVRAHEHCKLAENDARARAGCAGFCKVVRRCSGSARRGFAYRCSTTRSEVNLGVLGRQYDTAAIRGLRRGARHRRRDTILDTTPPRCWWLVRSASLYLNGVEDDKVEIGVLVNFGTLVPGSGVLHSEGVEVELFLKQRYLFSRGVLKVDPQEQTFILDEIADGRGVIDDAKVVRFISKEGSEQSLILDFEFLILN